MIKLPRTLHIEGSRVTKGQTDPDAVQFNKLREQFLVIEEKVDGSGVSLFFDWELNLHIHHRGSEAIGSEYRLLYEWARQYESELYCILEDRYVLFGEWMFKKHTIYYDCLPDFFLESDVYDQKKDIWLSTAARKDLFQDQDFIKHVPVISSGISVSLSEITDLVGKPKYQSDKWLQSMQFVCQKSGYDIDLVFAETDSSGLMEGLYIKHEDEGRVLDRYKYVRFDFVNKIINSGTHVKDRVLIKNKVK